MTGRIAWTRCGMFALTGTLILGAWYGAAESQTVSDDNQGNDVAPILGSWHATERHKSHGSLYQPIHEARRREAQIHFEQSGDRLIGSSVTTNFKQIGGQGAWNGTTKFDRIQYSNGRLVFEMDIVDWDSKLQPQTDALKQADHKGTIRVEAQLKGNRLIGKWGVFSKDGMEVYRGEWEALRSTGAESK